ncbi:MAG: type IIA DNA topoisomerase subunit B [Deltaproteobacteria bacterium]|nr:type IIA DNA topoisomerase subunit B [Deltaproteobacteria bacterium]
MPNGRYTARDITVLDGLEAVRKRPGMYIGGTGREGFHHLLAEILDNSVDEAMNGHATHIHVHLARDGRTTTVSDNGRGIPVDLHPKARVSALEVIFTQLHAGAKFDPGAYATAGGLHGVGASVVNALSSSLAVEVRRDGQEWRQQYRRGRPRAPVSAFGPARGTGTRITFTPDDEIFGEQGFDPDAIREMLDVKAYLHPGLRLTFRDEARGESHEFRHEAGLNDYLTHVVAQNGDHMVLCEPFTIDREEQGNGRPFRITLALQWTDSPREHLLSFVNGIPTRDGGTHEQGFKDGVVRAVRNWVETHEKKPRGLTILAEDVREGLVGVVSLLLVEPQFQGQTKDRLNNPEVRALVEGVVRPAFEQWLHEHGSAADTILSRILQAVRAREASRSAVLAVRRKSAVSRRLNLPGKLSDCASSDPEACEIFIVEGDSAGGSAKQGRDRETQAILPLRGKVLNTEQASLQKVLGNQELSDLVRALGCGTGKDFDLGRLRYHRIVLLMDADSDGHHIATLLLTFFYRHLPDLIRHGHVYIAQPPLYRIDLQGRTQWAADDAEKERMLHRLPARARPEITRFKGLGEMMPRTLYETTLDPRRRRLLQIRIPEGTAMEAESVIQNLLGRNPAARYEEIMARAGEVSDLDV